MTVTILNALRNREAAWSTSRYRVTRPKIDNAIFPLVCHNSNRYSGTTSRKKLERMDELDRSGKLYSRGYTVLHALGLVGLLFFPHLFRSSACLRFIFVLSIMIKRLQSLGLSVVFIAKQWWWGRHYWVVTCMFLSGLRSNLIPNFYHFWSNWFPSVTVLTGLPPITLNYFWNSLH